MLKNSLIVFGFVVAAMFIYPLVSYLGTLAAIKVALAIGLL